MQSVESHYIFYYPFNYRQFHFKELTETLNKNHFYHFRIKQEKMHEALYGPDVQINYQLLEQFYFPFIEEKLLNDRVSLVHFNRFSKDIGETGHMQTKFCNIKFTLHSADINLCPFGIGIIALRIQLHDVPDVTTALSFAHFFRVLLPKIDEELGAQLFLGELPYQHTEQLILEKIAPFLSYFFIDYQRQKASASKMPFFEDERMYVSGFMQVDSTIVLTDELLYRAGQLNGYDETGAAYISSTNPDYIRAFVDEHLYTRWMPDFAIMTTLQSHMQLTTIQDARLDKYLCNFHSISYYNVLIHYFYKMMLLKLAFEHSELKFSKDKDIVEELIEQITKFASRYYFSEVSVRTEGKEMAQFFRKTFRIDAQYREIKETLDELYRIQEDRSTDRLNELIFILTVFSMISGIYGMNLVIDKLDKPFEFSNVWSFTFFEWVAFLLTIVGLAISILLVGNQIRNLLTSYIERKRRARSQ